MNTRHRIRPGKWVDLITTEDNAYRNSNVESWLETKKDEEMILRVEWYGVNAGILSRSDTKL